jgi:hypothetical protein
MNLQNLSNKQKIYCLFSLSFLGLFLTFRDCLHEVVNLLNFNINVVLLLIAFIDVGVYIFLAPIPWIIARNNQLPGLVKGTLIGGFTLFLVGLLTLINLSLGKMIGGQGSFLPTLYSNFYFHTHLMVGIGYLISSWLHAEEKITIVEYEAHVAQSRLLQTQIHPQLLSNSLNGITELIQTNPDSAIIILKSLNVLLKSVIEASEKPTYKLAEERSFIEAYLRLESVRLGKRLIVHWDWDSSLNNLNIPPLVLQPLLENAIAQRDDTNPVLSLIVQNTVDGIRLAVENSQNSDSTSKNIGMNNLQSRLSLTFGNKAKFSQYTKDNWVVSEILIQ